MHTPAREWYVETPRNNLSYWGLDYPPASGYQSWLCGKAIAAIEPAAVALGTSHGYETPSSKRLMRLSVLFFDAVCFFPAALAAVRALYGARASPSDLAWALASVLLQPAFVLIDHGHFQYNNISLGLAAAAVAAIARGEPVLGSVLYTLSFNHKQMALFYAPAFFAHLLGRCFESRRPVLAVARLGAAVIGTMVLLWAPFLRDPGPLAVAARLAPIGRGVFEDFVASLWCGHDALQWHLLGPNVLPALRCVTSPVFRWRERFAAPTLARAAAALSLAACVPSCVQQALRPSRLGLPYCMLCCAMAAFLLGFQVHEKSVLLPLLPACLLALEEPELLRVLGPLAAFSMYPLLRFELLGGAAYAAALCAGVLVVGAAPRSARGFATRRGRAAAAVWAAGAVAGAAALHASYAVPAPEALPHLHALGVSAFSAANFAAVALYANVRQWQLPADGGAPTKRKKAA